MPERALYLLLTSAVCLAQVELLPLEKAVQNRGYSGDHGSAAVRRVRLFHPSCSRAIPAFSPLPPCCARSFTPFRRVRS